MRAYTHWRGWGGGVGHTDSTSAHFGLGKTVKFFLCSRWGSANLGIFKSRVRHSTTPWTLYTSSTTPTELLSVQAVTVCPREITGLVACGVSVRVVPILPSGLFGGVIRSVAPLRRKRASPSLVKSSPSSWHVGLLVVHVLCNTAHWKYINRQK